MNYMKQQPYAWNSVEIVGGGFVSGLFFHPQQKDLLYARTDIGGAYRWEPATRRWTPLQDWLEKKDWNLYGTESVGLDPSDPRRLYLAVGTYTNDWAGNGAILRSTDQGRTFQRADLPFKLGGNEDGAAWASGWPSARKTDGPCTSGAATRGCGAPATTRRPGSGWRAPGEGPHRRHRSRMGSLRRRRGLRLREGRRRQLWRSDDGGRTWKAVPGQPQNLLPHHGAIDGAGTLYLTYSNAPGPNGASDGAVWKRDKSGAWTDVTPGKSGGFGYAASRSIRAAPEP